MLPLPTLDLEERLWSQGFSRVAGVDEAGRGCLAGPVVASAVVLADDKPLDGLQDSKKLQREARENLAVAIKAEALAIGVGVCTPKEIDQMNILRAALEAMCRAVKACIPRPDYLLVDGNQAPRLIEFPLDTIIKGDATSQSIAAASIIAKTTRDEMMRTLHDDYPHYGWNTNVGYPTRAHYDGLEEHGPTSYHRHTFNLRRS